jgi:hypothetical protein
MDQTHTLYPSQTDQKVAGVDVLAATSADSCGAQRAARPP